MTIVYLIFMFWICKIGCEGMSTRCPAHWLARPNGNSCYRFWPTRLKSWTEARATCQARDGDLLKLDSKHEKEWVIAEIIKYPVSYEWWIGLRRHAGNNSVWQWADGTSRNETNSFLLWGSGEPNNFRDSEDCAEIWDNLLNDKNCEQSLQFVCERPADLPMKCDADTGWDDVTDNLCYKLYSNAVTYSEAMALCTNQDAWLLRDTNINVLEQISDFLDHKNKTIIWLPYQADTMNAYWTIGIGVLYAQDYWIGGPPDFQSISDNDTFCSVMDTNVTGIQNWKPENCDSVGSAMCLKNQGTCPVGYIKHKTSCYLLNTQDFMTWNEARGFCNLRSTQLLEITSENDWYFVLTMLKSHYMLSDIKSVWLGLSDYDDTNKNLTWDNSGNMGEFEHNMFVGRLMATTHQGEADCGFIDIDKKNWQLGDCGTSGGVICTVPVSHPIVMPPPEKPRYECPEGYTLNGVICYHWNADDPLDWYSAREMCAQEGADLAIIQSEEEQNFLSGIIQSEAWISLNDREKEGSFKWLDITTSQTVVTYWMAEQPNNADIGSQYSENCVAMHYFPGHGEHGTWVDYPCSFKARFVCQIPAEWNIALGKITTQSSNFYIQQHDSYYQPYFQSYNYYDNYQTRGGDKSNDEEVAYKAIDGCTTRSMRTPTCCPRTSVELDPWWQVDLGTYYPIGKIVIHRRSGESKTCPDCMSQFRNFRVFISNTSLVPDNQFVVYQEKRNHIPAIIILNLENITTGRYVRIDIPGRNETLNLCEVNIFREQSVRKERTSLNSNCITDSSKWMGTIKYTVSGKTCQAWALDVPHQHDYHDKAFPDGTEKDAKNFCRDPLGEGQPWCYTTDPDVRWEFCPVQHCYTEMKPTDVQAEATTDCGIGWLEHPETGSCYWFGEETLTWADAQSVCEFKEASLPISAIAVDVDDLTSELSNHQSDLFWLGAYFEIAKQTWVPVNDSDDITDILNQLGSSSPSKTMCVNSDKAGIVTASSCLDRNMYWCIKLGPFIKYRTSSDAAYKQVLSNLIIRTVTSSVTTYTLQFEFKGYDGATIMLRNMTDGVQSSNGYVIRIGGNIFAKSYISVLDSDRPKHSMLIYGLCSNTDYRSFWVTWTCGQTKGNTINVGRGTDVGKNIYLSWTNQEDMCVNVASIATVIKTSTVYQGSWRFKRVSREEELVNVAEANLALNRPAKQTGSYSSYSGADKVVDGCKDTDYSSKCVSHTLKVYGPWWEVDLGHAYPIKEVVVYRRWDCCRERLAYFRLIISAVSDSTLDEDVVYQSSEEYPPKIIHIQAQGRYGRYIKIDIPNREEFVELAEVEVFEDLDVSRCGNGWIDFGKESMCYKFSDVKMDWLLAKDFCTSLNSDMLIPQSPTEQQFIYESLLPIQGLSGDSRSVWLALHDARSDGRYVGVDGSATIYSDWGKNEPNFLRKEKCASIRIDSATKSGNWNNNRCSVNMIAVCKKNETPTTSTSTSTTTTTVPTTTTTIVETTTATVIPTLKPTTPVQGKCKPSWFYSPTSHSCLRIYQDNHLSFFSAAGKCMQVNSNLASIDNAIEQYTIAELIRMDGIKGYGWDGLWSAAIDEHKEGHWQWFMYNTSMQSSVKWSEGQPDNSHTNEKCGLIRLDDVNLGLLNDAPCDGKSHVNKGYVCKYRLEDAMCKDGWIANRQTDRCYMYERNVFETWHSAQKKCNQNDAILVTIGSVLEQLFLKALVSGSNVDGAWIGAHDQEEEGSWQWTDGTTWMDDVKWAPDQPNNWREQHCGMIVVDVIDDALGLLQDAKCSDKNVYLCAMKKCEEGWEMFGDKCYLFSESNRGWEDAKIYCESVGSLLVIVDSKEEHGFIRQKIKAMAVEYMWIGARYYSAIREHRWLDGSAMQIDGWAPGRPGTTQGCVDYLNNVAYLWNSHPDCVYTRGPFICEKGTNDIGGNGPTRTGTIVVSTQGATVQTTEPTLVSSAEPTTMISDTTLSTVTSEIQRQCGPGWDIRPNSDACYKFAIELASWTESQSKCSDIGGNLASIVSDEEQAYITGRLQGMRMLPEAMWIGASDTDFEAGWKWTDDQPFAYLNWAPYEPNDYVDSAVDGSIGEDCVAIATGRKYLGQWNDLECSGKRGYICKKKIYLERTTTKPTPVIEESEIIEFYQKAESQGPDFKSHDLYEMGVRPVDTFTFSVKTERDAHILLQNKRDDFSFNDNNYLVIISGGSGGTKSSIRSGDNIIEHMETGLLSPFEYRSFWISWNKTAITVGKSNETGSDVFLTYTEHIKDITYVSVGTAHNTAAHWKIPKGDKYYGCSGQGWLAYRDACFQIIEEQKNWNEANNYCRKQGAELASVADDDEQMFLYSQLPQDSYCFNTWKNDTMCHTWAVAGECDRNPIWMATHCHQACQHCVHNCRDTYMSSSKCLGWARIGECNLNPDWMIKNCAMSCGICQGAPTRGYWIGLQSSGVDQSYRWSDRGSVTFTDWDTHQPHGFNRRRGSCVAMYIQTGKWNDGQCSDLLPGFICKQPKIVQPFTTQSPFQVGCSMDNGYGYGAYCYVYIKEQKSWQDAKSNCNVLGGYLTYIGDPYTQAFVASELQNMLQDYWMGLAVTQGNWTWDGKQQSHLKMTHFDRSVKVGDITDGCFAMTTYKPVGLWKLYTCSTYLPSICQIPRDGFTTTLPPTAPSSTTQLPDCAYSWQPYGHNCYKLSNDEQTWIVAQEICTHYGAALVSLHDSDENRAVGLMAGNTHDVFWIGLHDTHIEGDFVWEDESPVDFLGWDSYEPNNAEGAEHCAELKSSNLLWNDAGCFSSKRYICKIPRGKDVNKEPPQIYTIPACDENSPNDGWVSFREYCYVLGNSQAVTWHSAQASCRAMGSQLASIHSLDELRFLNGLNFAVTWIGLDDLDSDDRFRWSDGSFVDFINWARDQPNDLNGGEKCVAMNANGLWHDFSCNDYQNYLCKKRKDGSTAATTASTTTTISGGCPFGFQYTFGNRCYYFSSSHENTNWGDAGDKCDAMGGQLVSIHSTDEQNFIGAHVFGKIKGMWIGMHELNEDGRFDWSDNSRLDFTYWAPYEPSSNMHDIYSKEPCVEMMTRSDYFGAWNDVKCYKSRGFICSSLKNPALPIQVTQCPEDYTFLRESCYKVLRTAQSWNDSQSDCAEHGGQLTTIADISDNMIVGLLMNVTLQPQVWIGGSVIEGKVSWVDGSVVDDYVLDRFGDVLDTGCVYSLGTYWHTGQCQETRAAICRIMPGQTAISSTVATVPTTARITPSYTFACRNSSWFLLDDYCYVMIYELTSFSNAQCSNYGMALASIDSAEENYKLISWMLYQHKTHPHMVYPFFWTGLIFEAGQHRWEDGSLARYNNVDFDKGVPSDGCTTLILFTGQWHVVSCTDRHYSLCRSKADIVTTPTTLTTRTSTDTPHTTPFRIPPFHHPVKSERAIRDTGMSGGQVVSIIIGVLGFLVIVGVTVYIIRTWTYRKPLYNFEEPSLGFDNALFHKSQDTVSIG